MPKINNTTKCARWRAKNLEKVNEYQRQYKRDNYEHLYEQRKGTMQKRYVWLRTAAQYRNILSDLDLM